jgi:hypothetical protein
MKRSNLRNLLIATAACAVMNGVTAGAAYAGEEYSFTVHNSTDSRITKLLASENKRSWGKFDIGSGIRAGHTVSLSWSQSTNSQSCKQWVKVVYADGSESEPAKFDFCESDLELEF